MRRLGVVGLVTLDRVDGGLPRLGGAPVYAARTLRLLGQPAVVATKLADEDRPRLAGLGVPVVAESAPTTIGFRIENDGDGRHMEIDELGEPFGEDDARGWLGRGRSPSTDWVHAGALTRADFPAATLAVLAAGAHRQPRRPGAGAARAARRARPRRRLRPGRPAPRRPAQARAGRAGRARARADGRVARLARRPRGGGDARAVAASVVYADGLAEHVPTIPLEGVDPTGAGDSWTTAYLCYRRQRHAPVSAARLANGAVGALLGR